MTSGSTVSLEVGQALAQMEFDHTVVAGCGRVKKRALGSLAYVANLPENVSVRTYMNFDMVLSTIHYPATEPLIDPLTETFLNQQNTIGASVSRVQVTETWIE